MIRLHQTFGAHAGRVLELERDVIRLGRLPDNEVAFDPHADLDASGRHAEIRREAGQWVLVDVGSRNGTLVAGQRVTRHVLRSGDEIEFGLGGPRVRVEMESGQRPAFQTAEATPVNAPRSGSAGGFETAAATPVGVQGAATPAPPVHLPVGAMPPGGSTEGGMPAPSALAHPTPPPSPFAGAGPGGGTTPTPGPTTPAPHSPGPMPPGPMSPGPMSPGPMTPAPASAPPGGPPMQPPSAGGEKRYGQRTVGMMIQAALAQADRQRAHGGNRSTAFIRAVAHEAASQSSRGLKIAIGIIALLLFLTLGAVVAVFLYARYQEQDLRDENVRLQRELADLGAGESSERERLEERIQELNEQLGDQQSATGSSIAEDNQSAVWVLLRTRNGRRTVVCSSFAVRPNLLATNAHCVGALERAMRRGDRVRAAPNRGRGDARSIERMWRHPQYEEDAPASPDVGLVRIGGTLPQRVQLATMPELTQLGAGDDVFVLGFPAQIADDGAPVAGLTTGVVGRVTAFDGTEAAAPMRHLVSHSAFTDDGTAGSPVFDRRGRVVAINAGNFRARRRVVDAHTRVARTVDAETPYAWAVRADLLLQLLAGLPSE
jgi:V8-like Glu-specific endopeptidase